MSLILVEIAVRETGKHEPVTFNELGREQR
jgi:hypothetical protein